MNVLTVNLIFSTQMFWIAAKLYVLPRLQELQPRIALLPILLLHSTRHLGLMFLAPGSNVLEPCTVGVGGMMPVQLGRLAP
jgi:hypothetical protein